MLEPNLEGRASKFHCRVGDLELDRETCNFYHCVLKSVDEAKVRFLIGGGYALYQHTGIFRNKDLDLFLQSHDVATALDSVLASGYKIEVVSLPWVTKILCGQITVDLISQSENCVAKVDNEWFKYAVKGDILGRSVEFCPPEEIIWSKAFIMERDRFDGADVAHLLLACSGTLDWQRLLRRFDQHWRVFLTHLILFGFIYPSKRSLIPEYIISELLAQLEEESGNPEGSEQICWGTVLSMSQYQTDVEHLGYKDARLYFPLS